MDQRTDARTRAINVGQPDRLHVGPFPWWMRGGHLETILASALLPRLVTELDRAGVGIVDLRVAEPSLDSVFLHITGTALRD